MRTRAAVFLAVTAIVLGGVFSLRTSNKQVFEFSDGKIIESRSGEVADDLQNYDAICLVGESSVLSKTVFECAGIAGPCPSFGDEDGILIARDGRCSFFAIHNAHVLFEYDHACSEAQQPLSIFHPNDRPILGFAVEEPKTDRAWSGNCPDAERRQTKSLFGKALL